MTGCYVPGLMLALTLPSPSSFGGRAVTLHFARAAPPSPALSAGEGQLSVFLASTIVTRQDLPHGAPLIFIAASVASTKAAMARVVRTLCTVAHRVSSVLSASSPRRFSAKAWLAARK